MRFARDATARRAAAFEQWFVMMERLDEVEPDPPEALFRLREDAPHAVLRSLWTPYGDREWCYERIDELHAEGMEGLWSPASHPYHIGLQARAREMLASAEQWTAQKAAAATAVGRGEAEARLNAARRDERTR